MIGLKYDMCATDVNNISSNPRDSSNPFAACNTIGCGSSNDLERGPEHEEIIRDKKMKAFLQGKKSIVIGVPGLTVNTAG